MSRKLLAPMIAVAWLIAADNVANAQQSLRITPAVQVIDDIGTAVLPVFTMSKPGTPGGIGSCAVIHSSGFMLTADHVTRDAPGVVLFGLNRVEYETVGRLPERDIAILRLKDLSYLQAVIQLGQSNDLKLGEPIIVGGNPSGRGVVFSQGSINAASIEPSWPSILMKSMWRKEVEELGFERRRTTGGRYDFIQFDATTNRGNSGGPVVNMERKLVGLVSQKSFEEEGINWAIPVDRIRMLLPHLIAAEEFGDFWTGIEIDPLASNGRIMAVVQDSPAWKAGLRADDILVEVDGKPIHQAFEWLFHLWGRKPNDPMTVKYDRSGSSVEASFTLEKQSTAETKSSADKKTGLQFSFYEGRFPSMPDFNQLKVVKQGVVPKLDRGPAVSGNQAKAFGIVFEGYMEFPEAGLYRLSLGSDDGSKLYINGRLVIDNDLGHPFQALSRWVRVPSGLIPFRLEYSELGGEGGLDLKASIDTAGEKTVTIRYYCDE